ncbi:MAG: site-specific integrase [bacterium]
MSINTFIEDGKTYYVVYHQVTSKIDPSIRAQRRTLLDMKRNRITSMNSAVAVEKQIIKDLMTKVAKLEGRGITWFELVDKWEDFHLDVQNQKFSYHHIRGVARRTLALTQDWVKKPVSEITRGDVRALYRRLNNEGASYGTIRKVKHSINVIFKWGIEERVIKDVTASPTREVEIEGKPEEKKPEILTREQVKILLNEASSRNHPWFPIWVMALYTGCRSGELLALRAESCSLVPIEIAREQMKLPPEKRSFGTITVERSWNPKERKYKSTKAKYWRTIPVSKDLYWFLLDLMAQDFGNDELGKFILPSVKEWKGAGEQAQVLRNFCNEIGIPSVRFHALRACFATHLLEMGVPSVKVMKIGGWKTLKTMEIYTRLAGVDVAGVTEGLGSIPSNLNNDQKVVNLMNFSSKKDPNTGF